MEEYMDSCEICLVRGRTLKPVISNKHNLLYFQTVGLFLDEDEMVNHCWECEAILRKIISFSKLVAQTRETLKKYAGKKTLIPHRESTLCIERQEKNVTNINYETELTDEFYVNDDANDFDNEFAYVEVPVKREFVEVPVEIPALTKPKKYLCKKCKAEFDMKSYYKDHIKNSHRPRSKIVEKKRAQCNQCDKTFSRIAGLQNHKRTVHVLKNKFPCSECDKVFSWKTSLKKHFREVHENKVVRAFCEDCKISFSSVCSYQRHLRISLKHVSVNELKFICDLCNRKFSNKTKLRDHIEDKHLHKTFQCHICHKQSKNRVCLVQHIRNVHSGRPNSKVCHFCAKGFPTKLQLESHVRTHTGERPYICEFCPTTFSQHSNLYKHKLTHLNMDSKNCKERKPSSKEIHEESYYDYDDSTIDNN